MISSLPPPAAAFVTALNRHDSGALSACFAPDAVVHDEGATHRGGPAIKAWFEDVSRKYRATLEVTDVVAGDQVIVLTADVSGHFEGSPIELYYRLTLQEGLITALRIAT